MSDTENPLFGRFTGEDTNVFGALVDGLVKTGAVNPPSEDVKQAILASRAAAPKAASPEAPPESAPAAAAAPEAPAPAPQSESPEADPLADMMAGAEAESASPPATPAGASQRVQAVSQESHADAQGAIDALLNSGNESGLLSAVSEAPSTSSALSGRIPGASAAAPSAAAPIVQAAAPESPAPESAADSLSSSEEDDLLAMMMAGDDSDSAAPAAPAPVAAEAPAEEESDPLAAMMGGDDEPSSAPAEEESDPLAAMMGGDDEPSSAPAEEESDPLAAMMGGDDEPSSAPAEEESDPLAAMMGGDDEPAGSESSGDMDSLFGNDAESASAPAAAAEPAPAPAPMPTGGLPALPTGRTTKKVAPDLPPGKLYLQLEKLDSSQLPMAVDQFLTDLESEFEETETEVPDALQAQLDKRTSRDDFPEVEDTGVIGESGKKVAEAAQNAAPGVNSIEQLLGAAPAPVVSAQQPKAQPQSMESLLSDEPQEPAAPPTIETPKAGEIASESMVEGWLGKEPEIPDFSKGEETRAFPRGGMDELISSPSGASGEDSGVSDSGVIDISREGAESRDKQTQVVGKHSDSGEAHTILLSKEEIKELEHAPKMVHETQLYEVVFGMLGFVLLLSGAAVYSWFYFYTGAY